MDETRERGVRDGLAIDRERHGLADERVCELLARLAGRVHVQVKSVGTADLDGELLDFRREAVLGGDREIPDELELTRGELEDLGGQVGDVGDLDLLDHHRPADVVRVLDHREGLVRRVLLDHVGTRTHRVEQVVRVTGHLVGRIEGHRAACQAVEQVGVRGTEMKDGGQVVDCVRRRHAVYEDLVGAGRGRIARLRIVQLVIDRGLDVLRGHGSAVRVLLTGLELDRDGLAVR